jgi:hypothetical protein
MNSAAEIRRGTWEELIGIWMRPGSKYFPQGLLLSDATREGLRPYLEEAIKTNVTPSLEAWMEIVNRATQEGRLQYAQATPAPVAEAKPEEPSVLDGMPDADEPLLKSLRCLEDVRERGTELSRKILQLGGHGVGGSRNELLDRLNRRLAWIQSNRIERSQWVERGELVPAEKQTKSEPSQDANITEALRLIDGLTYQDIGWSGDGGVTGKHAIVATAKKKLNVFVARAEARRYPAEQILAKVQDEIKKLGDCSIR